jgi:hypothetical protein
VLPPELDVLPLDPPLPEPLALPPELAPLDVEPPPELVDPLPLPPELLLLPSTDASSPPPTSVCVAPPQ